MSETHGISPGCIVHVLHALKVWQLAGLDDAGRVTGMFLQPSHMAGDRLVTVIGVIEPAPGVKSAAAFMMMGNKLVWTWCRLLRGSARSITR